MAVDSGMDLLSERAVLMRQSLQKSQTITDNVVSILGSFDSRLSALETAMRPTQVCLRPYLSSNRVSIPDLELIVSKKFADLIGFWVDCVGISD